jgi:hypothetical protein
MLFQLEIRPKVKHDYESFVSILQHELNTPLTTGIKDLDRIREHYKLDIDARMVSSDKKLGKSHSYTTKGVIIRLSENDARNSNLFQTCSYSYMYISTEIFYQSLLYEQYSKDEGEYGKPVEITILFNENKFLEIWRKSGYKYDLVKT